MQTTYTLNIGLTNCTIPVPVLLSLLDTTFGNVVDHTQSDGVYDGKKEPTLVVNVNTNKNLSDVIFGVEKITQFTNQDCIAIQTDYFEALVYYPLYRGERQKFNETFFIKLESL